MWGGPPALLSDTFLSPQSHWTFNARSWESPWVPFMAVSLGIPARSSPFRRRKDLALGLPCPRQRPRWGRRQRRMKWHFPFWLLPSFLFSTFLPKKRKKLSETIWVPQAELTNSIRPFKFTFHVNLLFLQRFSQFLPHFRFYFLTGYGAFRAYR